MLACCLAECLGYIEEPGRASLCWALELEEEEEMSSLCTLEGLRA